MSKSHAVLGVAVAAVAIWLVIRIINRRERWTIRTAVGLIVALVGYQLIDANVRPGRFTTLGHVSFEASHPLFPGVWISGHDYGWPWIYKTVSFKTESVRIDNFDEFNWTPLMGNAAVGLVILVAVGVFAGWVGVRISATGQPQRHVPPAAPSGEISP
jgi:hypothetical protein